MDKLGALECVFNIIDSLLNARPMLAAKIVGSTTIGNHRAEIKEVLRKSKQEKHLRKLKIERDNSGWTIFYPHIEEIYKKAINFEPTSLEVVEAVVLAMMDCGFVQDIRNE